MNHKFSANMLVGKFPEPYVKYSLESIKWIDEIVIVYNNVLPSNKEAIEKWAQSYQGRLITINYNSDTFDFAAARNIAIDASSGDFILKIDADEVYFESFQKRLRSLSDKHDMYRVFFIHMFNDIHHYRFIEPKEVLFRNCRWIRWAHPVHERLHGYDSFAQLTDKFMHLGYIKPPARILEKWKLYAKLEGQPDMFDYITDIEGILDGVDIHEYTGPYPEVLKELLNG